MKENISIELTKQSVTDLQNLGRESVVDLQHLPFSDFEFKLPMANDYSEEEVLETVENMDFFKKLDEKEKKRHIKHVVDTIKKDNLFFKTTIKGKEILIEDRTWYLKAVANDWVIDCKTDPKDIWESLEIEGTTENAKKFIHNDETFVRSCLSNLPLALGIIAFLQSDKKDVIRVETKTVVKEKKKKSKSKGKRSNKTYLYNKRYIIGDDDTKDLNVSHRPYERKTEQWLSRGHWRHYKSGKKVWIPETVKKAKDAISSSVKKEYKITKVN